MKNRVITISREFGSGGRTIGKMVAEKLGIPCYDAEIIEKIAKESGYSDEYIRTDGFPTYSQTVPWVLPTRIPSGSYSPG